MIELLTSPWARSGVHAADVDGPRIVLDFLDEFSGPAQGMRGKFNERFLRGSTSTACAPRSEQRTPSCLSARLRLMLAVDRHRGCRGILRGPARKDRPTHRQGTRITRQSRNGCFSSHRVPRAVRTSRKWRSPAALACEPPAFESKTNAEQNEGCTLLRQSQVLPAADEAETQRLLVSGAPEKVESPGPERSRFGDTTPLRTAAS